MLIRTKWCFWTSWRHFGCTLWRSQLLCLTQLLFIHYSLFICCFFCNEQSGSNLKLLCLEYFLQNTFTSQITLTDKIKIKNFWKVTFLSLVSKNQESHQACSKLILFCIFSPLTPHDDILSFASITLLSPPPAYVVRLALMLLYVSVRSHEGRVTPSIWFLVLSGVRQKGYSRPVASSRWGHLSQTSSQGEGRGEQDRWKNYHN